MAYGNQCRNAGFACEWIMRFSSLKQTYLGDELGIPGDELTLAVNGPADAVARSTSLGTQWRASGPGLQGTG